MLKFSLSRTGNLLAGMKRYPARMIVHFAKADPEAVRNMFANLFRPERDIYGRIDEFKTQSALLLEKHADQGKQHYQNENAVSTYLWLRYRRCITSINSMRVKWWRLHWRATSNL